MPGAFTAFREVVYRGELRPHEIVQARASLGTCLEALLSSPLLADLVRCAPHEIVPPDAGPLAFEPVPGHPAWAALDLAYLHHAAESCGGRIGAPTWCVCDVKSGRPHEDDGLQLAAYALCLATHYGLPATGGAYLGRAVYLRTGDDVWFVLGEAELAAARETIRRDVEGMRRLLGATPRERLAAGRYGLAGDPRACTRCNFFALCEEEIALRRGALWEPR